MLVLYLVVWGLFFSFFFFFLGSNPRHMEVPRLGVQLEQQLPAYATATATRDPSHICDLHYSSRQHQILNPRSEVRDPTCNLMVPSQICFHRATMGTPLSPVNIVVLQELSKKNKHGVLGVVVGFVCVVLAMRRRCHRLIFGPGYAL